MDYSKMDVNYLLMRVNTRACRPLNNSRTDEQWLVNLRDPGLAKSAVENCKFAAAAKYRIFDTRLDRPGVKFAAF